MKIRICPKCNLVTDHRKCMICGKATMKTTKEELKFNGVLVKGKLKDNVASSGIKRHPRLPSKAELDNKDVISIIESKCEEFDCPGHVIGVKPGPIVTQFNYSLNSFVRYKRVRDMHDDLAMALARENVTITRIPGESAVAIMVPNKERKVPKFEETLPAYLAHRKDMELPLNLGVDSLGNPVVVDLTRLPHLLIGGETGSGKSVLLNTIITSLLYARSPKQLQFMLIDSKTVELTGYKDLPHCNTAPATDVFEALRIMSKAEQEMRRRMSFINFKGCKNLRELNAKLEPEERLPYIVMVIDEMADLVLQMKKEFTTQMAIIAGMARAAGVHVIAATQRPSVDVVSGKIKVNFPARLAFHVTSSGDSKTILTTKGAEQLSAKGDAFAILPERSGLTRIHTPFCQEADVKKMMRASILVGHTFRVPADITAKELARLEKEMSASQKASSTSIADAMENTAEEGPIQ